MTPWTFDQFLAAMQAAGWRRDLSTGRMWHKDTGAEFHPFNWSRYRKGKYGYGEAWREFAALRVTPTEAPF